MHWLRRLHRLEQLFTECQQRMQPPEASTSMVLPEAVFQLLMAHGVHKTRIDLCAAQKLIRRLHRHRAMVSGLDSRLCC